MSGQHTPGPWLMATKPSSVVGWPIVAPNAQGRLVASLNYASPQAFGGPQSGDRSFNKESEANGNLIAAAPDLLAALEHILGGALSLPRFAEDEARAAIAKARGEASA